MLVGGMALKTYGNGDSECKNEKVVALNTNERKWWL